MFPGFSASETFVPIPESFFRRLLREIYDADELKATLYALWLAASSESQVQVFRKEDFADLVSDPGSALNKATARGTLLRVESEAQVYYLLNSPRGRAAAEAIRKGEFDPVRSLRPAPPAEHPNIFRLYEENIGPLTPLLADALRDAEQTYSPEWVAEALEIAVTRNKRNWRYVEAILKRWKEEGHAQKQNQRDAQKSSRRYSEGQFAEYLRNGETDSG
ncbi:MAG: DnaD domain protein [Anaerolineales bacterium]|nr:DnaD domain protein [Anaerolineales bacterium]MCX7609349.1 DnaD domain protein [Anaerolineales bacterium]MDW8226429.1 DnaD domain protein [Anaerolineales bacterium]